VRTDGMGLTGLEPVTFRM